MKWKKKKLVLRWDCVRVKCWWLYWRKAYKYNYSNLCCCLQLRLWEKLKCWEINVHMINTTRVKIQVFLLYCLILPLGCIYYYKIVNNIRFIAVCCKYIQYIHIEICNYRSLLPRSIQQRDSINSKSDFILIRWLFVCWLVSVVQIPTCSFKLKKNK